MKKSILIIDDSESIREVITLGLSNAGYNVIAGINGKDGLRLLNENPAVKMIITDLNMPEMDGLTFLKEVRRNEVFRFVPIIILTTESQEAKRQEAKLAGATGWIIKPFANDKLLTVVKKVIR